MSQDSRKDLACAVCGNLNYATRLNPKGKAKTQSKLARLVLQKYCRKCHKHTEHKETK